MASLLLDDLVSLTKRLGGKELGDFVQSSPPPVLPVPTASLEEMRHSLNLVLHALTHKLHLEGSEEERLAAKAAFASWHATNWLDPRDNRLKPKPASCWTIEQYGLCGFSALYAKRLHTPRMAAARQVVLWLLECAPGLPGDHPISFADLGAGTCAACLGCKIALHEHAGNEQPFRAFAIDLASSANRFAKAFGTMCRHSAHGRQALLPGQSADQYLHANEPGIAYSASSLFDQLSKRNERQPHLIVASFSLHYLKPNEREDFYRLLRSLVTAPLLLLVIKGIGESGSQFSNKIVKSLHYGLHYAIGSDRSSPRVVESHLCLILPKDWSEDTIALAAGSSEGSAERNSDAWVLQTFAAVEKRVQKEGLWTGVTLFDSHVGQIGL